LLFQVLFICFDVMNAVYKQSDFFGPDHHLGSLFFNVGFDTDITAALPEHCSVSGSPDSDGVLDAMVRIRGAEHRHHSNEEIGNLFDWVAKDQPPFIHLIGHGAAGVLLTGCAQTSIQVDSMLDGYTHTLWRTHMERLSRYDEDMQEKIPVDELRYSGGLLLEGSCVAAGEDGLRLMKRLANVTCRTVFAYTGVIIVNNEAEVLYEKGHQWLRQEPHDQQRYLKSGQNAEASLDYGNIGASRKIPGMDKASLQKIDIHDIHTMTVFSVDGDVAELLFSELDSLVAFQQEGHVLGYITYQFEFYFEDRLIKAALYSERLLRTSAGVSYFVTPRFVNLLKEELRQRFLNE